MLKENYLGKYIFEDCISSGISVASFHAGVYNNVLQFVIFPGKFTFSIFMWLCVLNPNNT